MALNDLWTQLTREEVKISRNEEVRVVDAILKSLTDQNNDVKSVAVKCVAVLVKKVEQKQIEVICDNLCELIRSEQKDQAELRDIYSIALKTLISDVPDIMGDEVTRHLTVKLVSGINSQNRDIKKECLILMEQCLERFGTSSNSANHHENIMNTVLRQLALPGAENKTVRKISADCLGALALVSSEDLLNLLVEIILELIAAAGVGNGAAEKAGISTRFQANKRTEILAELMSAGSDIRTLIQTIGTISRTVGHRLGRHLIKLVPLFMDCIGAPISADDDTMEDVHDDQDMIIQNEIREYCLTAIESFVKCCPQEITPFLITESQTEAAGMLDGKFDNIIAMAMAFIRFDPNYVGDNSEYDMEEDGSGGEYSDDNYSASDYSDEEDDADDTSWKVRRAATKLVKAVIIARPDINAHMYEECADGLLRRFRERAEQVRVDILECFTSLIENTTIPGLQAQDPLMAPPTMQRANSSGASPSPPQMKRTGSTGPGTDAAARSLAHTRATLNSASTASLAGKGHLLFMGQLEDIMESSCRLLVAGRGDKDISTKGKVLEMLIKLLGLAGPALDREKLELLLRDLTLCIRNEKLSALRLSQLQVLHLALEHSSADIVQDILAGNMVHVNVPDLNLLQLVVQCVNDDGYKNIAAAVRVMRVIIGKLRPLELKNRDFDDMVPAITFNANTYIRTIYDALLPRLEAQDLDQEIKKATIISVGSLLYHAGDLFDGNVETDRLLNVLHARLENEITRVSSLRALTQAAQTPVSLSLAPVLRKECLQLIAAFSKQQSREMRVTSLQCMDALLSSNACTPQTFGQHGQDAWDMGLVNNILQDVSTVINATDLYLAHLALKICITAVNRFVGGAETGGDSLGVIIKNHVYAPALALASSPLIQGVSQQTVVNFFRALVYAAGNSNSLALTGLCFADIFADLYTNSEVLVVSDSQAKSSGGDASPTRKGGSSSNVNTNKQGVLNLALCVAGVCTAASVSAEVRDGTITAIAEDIVAISSRTHLALLCLGELGKQVDLASSATLQTLSLETRIMKCFESPSSDTQMAAAYALGNLALGNMEKYIPLILSPLCVPSQEKLHYLLLASLREILQVYANAQAALAVQELMLTQSPTLGTVDLDDKKIDSQYIDQMAPAVLAFASSSQPQVRNSCAECLGLLAYLAPAQLLPPLQQLYADNPPAMVEMDKEQKEKEGNVASATSKETHTRWTSATAVRFAFSRTMPSESRQTEGETATISACLRDFLPTLLQDSEVEVRKAAVLTISALVHRNLDLLAAPLQPSTMDSDANDAYNARLVDLLFPYLLEAMKCHIKVVVDTGPFKIREDMGLPLRKAAFMCVDVLVDIMPVSMTPRVGKLIEVCEMNMGEKLKVKEVDNNIDFLKMHVHFLVQKLCVLSPGTMLAGLEVFLKPLKDTVEKTLKEGASASDIERIDDLRRNAFRTVVKLKQLEGTHAALNDFVDNFLMRNPLWAESLLIAKAEMQER